MIDRKYEVVASNDWLIYEFVSIGPKGKIPKTVIYQHIDDNIYNLAFGDKDSISGNIDDLVITDNQDTEIVLANVASTLFDFFDNYNGTIVLAKGSTQSRTRLYRRYLTILLEIIEENFLLLGELNGEVERFKKNKEYTSFLITKLQKMLKDAVKRKKTEIDPTLTEKYKGQVLFKEKYEWAMNHVKGRDIKKEIEEALNKERITKP